VYIVVDVLEIKSRKTTESSTWNIIKNCVLLDVYGVWGELPSGMLDADIKLIWNLFLRLKYNEDILSFTGDEADYLLTTVSVRNIRAPRYIAVIDRMLSERIIDHAYQASKISDMDIEFYLAHYITYIRDELFDGADFEPEVDEWLNEPVEFSGYTLPRQIQSLYYSSEELLTSYSLSSKTGTLGLLGWYCLYKLYNVTAQSLPKWLNQLIDTPAEISGSDDFKINQFLEAVYWSHSEYANDFDIHSEEGRIGWLGWFCHWKASTLPYYQHPGWLNESLQSPSKNFPVAAKLGMSIFFESLWRANPAYSTNSDLSSEKSTESFVVWLINNKGELLKFCPLADWQIAICNKLGVTLPVVDSSEDTLSKVHEVEDSRTTVEPVLSGAGALECSVQSGGVNLVGWPRTEIGIGEDVRVAAMALDHVDLPFCIIDAADKVPPMPQQKDLGFEQFIKERRSYNIDITFLDAATQYRYYSFDQIKKKKLSQTVIGVCPWELPHWPDDVVFALDHVDVFWAATEFIYHAFEKHFPSDRIALAPPVVTLAENGFESIIAASYDGPFQFLTTFDGLSSIHRKNPMAAIDAFQAAFPKDVSDVSLVVKMMNLSTANETLKAVLGKIASDHRISIINETLSRSDLFSLVKESHCFVSLHRSEGFGRNIAEAMLLGRPTICSAYSGNLDFCNDQTSFLVSGREVAVLPEQYSYSRGQMWFDPSVEEAALKMQDVYQNREKMHQVANSAREFMLANHSPDAVGSNYVKLLSKYL